MHFPLKLPISSVAVRGMAGHRERERARLASRWLTMVWPAYSHFVIKFKKKNLYCSTSIVV